VTKPVLEVVRARIDVDGVPQVDGLSLSTGGDRILILGSAQALFECVAGLRPVRHGAVDVRGVSAMLAVAESSSAGVPLDPPLPPSWTVRAYVTWSARLAGHAAAEAYDRATDALARLKLVDLQQTTLRSLTLHARRAVVIAGALATGASTLLLEDPLRGLPGEAARTLARLLVRATSDVSTVIFAPRVSLASPLATDADEALLIHGSRVVAQGAPGEVAARDRAFALRLHRGGAAFARLAEERGARLEGHGAEWAMDLGHALQTRDIFEIATASDTVVLEIHPLAEAFA
jgi:ABC-type multidrug transport system ATPase subunit